jgi:hypothetical protein
MHGKMISDMTNGYGVRIQTFDDGSSAVVVDEATALRRERATLAFKVRVNKALGVASPKMEARIAELSR